MEGMGSKKLGMVRSKRAFKNWGEIVRPVPVGLRQWITDVYEETKHTGYVLGSLRIRESVSKIGKRLGHEKQWFYMTSGERFQPILVIWALSFMSWRSC